MEKEEHRLSIEKLPEEVPELEDESLRLKLEQAQDESTPLEELRALSEDESEEVRITLALRETFAATISNISKL